MLALAHLKFVIARGCVKVAFPDRLPVSQSFESTLLWKGGHIFPWPIHKVKLRKEQNNYYFLFTTAYRLIILIFKRSLLIF